MLALTHGESSKTTFKLYIHIEEDKKSKKKKNSKQNSNETIQPARSEVTQANKNNQFYHAVY